MRVTPLPYREDSTELFDRIAGEPWAVFLDSGHPLAGGGRDILAARPYATCVVRGGETRIADRNGLRIDSGDPLLALRGLLGEPLASGDFPFAGGAIGYLSYDLARRLDLLAPANVEAGDVPDMAFGLYDWAVLVDHDARTAHLVSSLRDPATMAQWDTLVELFSASAPSRNADWSVDKPPAANFDWPGYRAACERVLAYIAAGDCYQINLTQRYEASVRGSHWALYKDLRRINPAPHGAYLNLPDLRVLSTSPERFVELRAGRVVTRPIKGTRPRGHDPVSDEALARELAASEKDRAENLMIVDLLRNDLGRVCETGSVAVSALFEVERFAHVHHLVSTVTGHLAPGRDAVDLLRATFPGGSITGAPKRRAMAIIDELEPHRRGVYCGAIGYLGFNGNMDTNIAIRTLVAQGERVHFGVGGGIVADSVPEREFQECLDKAAPLLKLLHGTGPG